MSLHQALQLVLARIWSLHAATALPSVQREEGLAFFSKDPLSSDGDRGNSCYTEASFRDGLEAIEDAEMLSLDMQLLQARVVSGRHATSPSSGSFPQAANANQEPETESSKVPAGRQIASMPTEKSSDASHDASHAYQSAESGSTSPAQFFQIDSVTETHPHTKKPADLQNELQYADRANQSGQVDTALTESTAKIFSALNDEPVLGLYTKLYVEASLQVIKKTAVGVGAFLCTHSIIVVSFVVAQLVVTAAILRKRCWKRRHDASSKESAIRPLCRYEKQAKERINFDQFLVHRRFEEGPAQDSTHTLGIELNIATVAPEPPKKLAHVGASFVVPLASGKVLNNHGGKRIWLPEGSGKLEVSFEIPVWPAALPLKASLIRETNAGPWGRIELTQDFIAAAGMPPLLWCKPAEQAACSGDCGGTGGADIGIGSSNPRIIQSSFEVHDRTQGVVAVLRPEELGVVLVARRGLPPWHVQAHPLGNAIVVRRTGQEIAMAREMRNDEITQVDSACATYLQVDTAAGSDAPESSQILLSILAMMAFSLMK